MANRYPFTLIEDGETVTNLEGPKTRTLLPTRTSSTTIYADGTARRDVFYPLHLAARYPGDLFPEERMLQRVGYDYDLMSVADLDFIEYLKGRPSIDLTLIEWGFPIFPSFTGDGVKRVLRQYHAQAADVLTLPPVSGTEPRTPEKNRSVPFLWLNGAPITLTSVDQATWDADLMPPGEAWWLLGGKLWKFAEAPPLKAKIKTQYLPARPVVEQVDADSATRTASTSAVDPRRLVLVERGGL